ncbi:hypothetical protein KHQ06_07090 [Nocardia tengchongensis]|uniref:Secreted protein n=1 Tax=Nocardia tengchongensis TaxID=2055889 RepID=A0ABX8CS91_9NOCA|nr:hypothetical protein [Nocardia tengchongensis]QVI22753.1 hypothetical protein KHQ06_07090 [Nocardia tengchongensis]
MDEGLVTLKNNRIRRVGLGMAGFTAVAAVCFMTAVVGAPASADVIQCPQGVAPQVSSSKLSVGQTYTLTVPACSGATTAWFSVFSKTTNKWLDPQNVSMTLSQSGGTAVFTASWTPSQTGGNEIHVIEQSDVNTYISNPNTVTVNAAPATSTGSADSIPVIGGLLKSLGL